MMKRKREARRRVKVARRSTSMRFAIHPDPDKPHVVEVRIARSRAIMRGELRRIDGAHDLDDADGVCRSWHSRITKRCAVRPRMIIARIYLNKQSLSRRPSEIVSHECAHAAMAWARMRNSDLHKMIGEEVMCHALGRLVAQANRVCYAAMAFK